MRYILSMEMAGILLVVSAISIGLATFIENDFGTAAAKALVFNSLWFELMIGLVFINLLVNSIKIKPWKSKQWSVFIFHVAFLLIILGSAITRYIGYEGTMNIREGQMSNVFKSDVTYVMIQDAEGNMIQKKKVLFSSVSDDEVSMNFQLNGKNYKLKTFDFIPNAAEYIDESGGNGSLIEITLRSGSQFQSYYLPEGQQLNLKGHSIGFNNKNHLDINITSEDGQLFISGTEDAQFFDMMTGEIKSLNHDSTYTVVLQKVYTYKDLNWVFKQYYPQGKLAVTSANNNRKGGVNAINFAIFNDDGEQIHENYAIGTSGYSDPKNIVIDGTDLTVSYGSEEMTLPFSIMLRDFQLERYPASNSPSSYASEVTLIDPSKDLQMDYRIYMNHVLDHRGYRFFQSSYDKDELGTVLSVNHDFFGMVVTYLGYALMSLAMFFALFAKNSRFRFLMKGNKTASILLIALFISPLFSQSQNFSKCKVDKIPDEQIDNLSRLLVQGHSGRFQPFNSISSQVVRKFSRKITYDGLNSDRILLGIMMNPDYWVQQPMIKVSNNELKKIIGIEGSTAKFVDFFDSSRGNGAYKLSEYVEEAYQKKPAERGTFDKDIITVDERVNVFYMAMNSDFMKIFPVPNSPNQGWKSPMGPFAEYRGQDSVFVSSVFGYYLQSLQSGNYPDASLMLQGIKQFQDRYADHQLENLSKMEMEITYNKINIFDRLFAPYGIAGFIMLILIFVKVMAPKYKFTWPVHILAIIILLAFVAHTLGLVTRWYIAGHAPWSNGFEAMIFIGWATVLAGLIFYKKSPIALAATSILAFLFVYVAHLSWMNPEITDLVPVLKSYWLTIHVAVITASYGFLALGALMGFINLIFFILQNKNNLKRVSAKVGEITRINEMTIIVGLYLLTIGTFLGGVWANESWGRYWGWDPKETWALVTVLVYSFILHMRFIPGMKSLYSFNLMTVIGYSSVLMTFFGVNYYLSGLHSYASGDPMPIPDFVYYTVAIIFVISSLAYWKYRKIYISK